jgi:hypothetical protein
MLVAAGADDSRGNGRALRYASAGEHEGVIRVLIEAGGRLPLIGDSTRETFL